MYKWSRCVSINVGIDVSKESLDVCLLSDQTKSGQRYRKFKNDKGAHSDLSSWLLKTAKCNLNHYGVDWYLS
ncbi:hypothetical protein VCRA2116O29_560026 [Vibrio crassostreae]|nr:hypothetical protein VCRA2116O29_560026 [Vibrio crassostreae]CAK3860425.1 hypothetical protein VCRA2123O74_530026 [Vibrio crassostreae]